MSDDLNRELAEAMGWRHYGKRESPLFVPAHWQDGGGARHRYIPDFTTSLDALRDGPERVLREAGWHSFASFDPSGDLKFGMMWSQNHGEAISRSADTEAEARARAALAALNALKVEAR